MGDQQLIPPQPSWRTAHERRHRRRRVGWARFIRSFYHASAGIIFLFRTQRNARVELAIALAAIGLGLWLGLSVTQWAILVLSIAAVLILEGLNTAMEAVVDLASPRIHPLAKAAKDVTAGMVLLAAIAAVIVGLLLFVPPLMRWLS
jgi:diacylglycerol kinase